MWAIVPFSLLFLFNLMIISKMMRFHRNLNSNSAYLQQTKISLRKTQMNRTILIMTFLFVGLTLPQAIITGFFYTQIMLLDAGPVIINFLDNISFSFPALDFFTLIYTNKIFAKEVKSLVSKMANAVRQRILRRRRSPETHL
jgi:hypothetical protein